MLLKGRGASCMQGSCAPCCWAVSVGMDIEIPVGMDIAVPVGMDMVGWKGRGAAFPGACWT